MNNIIKIIGAFLLSALVFYYIRYNLAQNKIHALEMEKTDLKTENEKLSTQLNNEKGKNATLEAEIEKRNKAILAADKRARELEEAAKSDKSGFDWNADISNSAVIKRLQAR